MLIGQHQVVVAVVVDAVEDVQIAPVTGVECLRGAVVANHLLEDAPSAKHFLGKSAQKYYF
jgi:hypothetical protein